MIDWTKHITSTPKILGGKPIIIGARISVEFLLERLTDGWTEAEIPESYPHILEVHLRAVRSL